MKHRDTKQPTRVFCQFPRIGVEIPLPPDQAGKLISYFADLCACGPDPAPDRTAKAAKGRRGSPQRTVT